MFQMAGFLDALVIFVSCFFFLQDFIQNLGIICYSQVIIAVSTHSVNLIVKLTQIMICQHNKHKIMLGRRDSVALN